MRKTRCERAAEKLRAILQEIAVGKKWRLEVFCSPKIVIEKEVADDSSKKTVKITEYSIEDGVNGWELEAVLYCLGNKDPFYEFIKHKIIHDKKAKEDPWKNYKAIVRDFTSKLWKNADLEVYPLYLSWIQGTSQNPLVNPDGYTFAPHKKELLLTCLRRLRKFIDNPQTTRYQRELARALFNELLPALFEGVGFRPKEQKAFMIERELVPFKAYKDRGSKRNPSRIPLDPMLCKRIIELAIDKFLKTLNLVYIETLIYIWLAQSGAKQGRKTISVKDIFAIHLEDLTTTEDVMVFGKIQRVIRKGKVAKGKPPFYVSSVLIQLIKSYVDKRCGL